MFSVVDMVEDVTPTLRLKNKIFQLDELEEQKLYFSFLLKRGESDGWGKTENLIKRRDGSEQTTKCLRATPL